MIDDEGWFYDLPGSVGSLRPHEKVRAKLKTAKFSFGSVNYYCGEIKPKKLFLYATTGDSAIPNSWVVFDLEK